jgi:G3E family GTPase
MILISAILPPAGVEGGADMTTSGRVPVTLIAGWHGSGKSSLLERIARHTDPASWGLVVPTSTPPIPAALRIETEEEVVERVAGCQRCAVRHDLIWALRWLTRRRRPPARVFVELTGWADPAVAAQTVMRDPGLAHAVVLDGVITVVDAGALWTRACSGRPLWPAVEAADQLAVADVVVVRGLGRLPAPARPLAASLLREANWRARMVVDRGAASGLGALLDIGALTTEAAERASQAVGRQETFPPSGSRGHMVEVAGALAAEGFDGWLVGMDHDKTRRLLRVAGILCIAGETSRVACHRIGTCVHVERTGPWETTPPVSRLFVAGRHLDRETLQSSLQHCVHA